MIETINYPMPDADTNASLLRFCKALRVEQIIENNAKKIEPEVNTGDILSFYYYQSSLAEIRHQQAIWYCTEGIKRREIEESLAGAICEDAAMLYLPNLLNTQLTALSQQKIMRLYKKMFPSKYLIEDLFNQYGLSDISLPDMLVVGKNGNIEIVGEVSAVRAEDGIDRMYSKYDKEFVIDKYCRENPLFASAEFWWIAPKDFEGEEDPEIGDLRIKRLPFSYADLRNCKEMMYMDAWYDVKHRGETAMQQQPVDLNLHKNALTGLQQLLVKGTYISDMLMKYPSFE